MSQITTLHPHLFQLRLVDVHPAQNPPDDVVQDRSEHPDHRQTFVQPNLVQYRFHGTNEFRLLPRITSRFLKEKKIIHRKKKKIG